MTNSGGRGAPAAARREGEEDEVGGASVSLSKSTLLLKTTDEERRPPDMHSQNVSKQVSSSSSSSESGHTSTVTSESEVLLCFRIGAYSRTFQFLATSVVVVILFVLYGYFQELIFRLEGFRTFGWYLTLTQFAYYTVFGLVERQSASVSGMDTRRRIPWSTYLMLASLTVATMGLSNTAVGYLNYPTAVIFKSCKLIPVLIGGMLIQGKRYGVLDVLASLFMSVGLVFFTLADSEVSPNFNSYGFALISLALCADAVIGNVQEKAMKQHQESNANVVLYSYAIGFLYILVGEVITGELVTAFRFCAKHPIETYGYAAVFSITGYLGLHVVLTQVRLFGALIAVTVTSCRKALSIVLSFMLFAKPFTITYLWSGLMVLLGIQLNLYSGQRSKVDTWLRELMKRLGARLKSSQAVLPRSGALEHVA